MFSGSCASTKYFSAKLNVKKDGCSICLKPRSVPFALREAIETEIKWLEAEGIIEKVPHNKWAAPIVSIDSVPKGNRKIRTSETIRLLLIRISKLTSIPFLNWKTCLHL